MTAKTIIRDLDNAGFIRRKNGVVVAAQRFRNGPENRLIVSWNGADTRLGRVGWETSESELVTHTPDIQDLNARFLKACYRAFWYRTVRFRDMDVVSGHSIQDGRDEYVIPYNCDLGLRQSRFLI